MKKATSIKRTRKLTPEQIRSRKPTKRQRDELAAITAMPDNQIATNDIPEITDSAGWMDQQSALSSGDPVRYDPAERLRHSSGQVPFEVQRNAAPNIYQATSSHCAATRIGVLALILPWIGAARSFATR